MMSSQSFFIPLYFDETEADLWLALQGIEPEKRSSFIKSTLRQVLLNEVDAPNADFLIDELEKDEFEEYQKHEGLQEFEENGKIDIFSLEALFTEAPKHNPKAGGLVDHEELKPILQRAPWDYLLQSVIGVEEDEGVIAALKQVTQTNHSGLQVNEPDRRLDKAGDQEFDFESLQVDTPISSAGFEYMMKHIIGTEEDEVVLKVLRGGPDLKFEVRGSKFDSK